MITEICDWDKCGKKIVRKNSTDAINALMKHKEHHKLADLKRFLRDGILP